MQSSAVAVGRRIERENRTEEEEEEKKERNNAERWGSDEHVCSRSREHTREKVRETSTGWKSGEVHRLLHKCTSVHCEREDGERGWGELRGMVCEGQGCEKCVDAWAFVSERENAAWAARRRAAPLEQRFPNLTITLDRLSITNERVSWIIINKRDFRVEEDFWWWTARVVVEIECELCLDYGLTTRNICFVWITKLLSNRRFKTGLSSPSLSNWLLIALDRFDWSINVYLGWVINKRIGEAEWLCKLLQLLLDRWCFARNDWHWDYCCFVYV